MTKEGQVVESIIERLGCREDLLLFKNVSGGLKYGDRYLRAGILKSGSSDLLIVRRLLIEPHHVGRYVGLFNALEVKADLAHDNTDKKRKAAQETFIRNIQRMGGQAGFVDNADDAERIVYGI